MFDAPAILHRHRRWVLGITICLWITACVLTHLPPGDVPDLRTGDATLHSVGFWGLASWFLLTLVGYRVKPLRRVLIVFAVMAAYGALDENTQPWFGRTCDLGDWINDMTGTAVAVGVWEIVLGAFRKKGSHPTAPAPLGDRRAD